MPYLLRFDGSNDYVSGDSAASVTSATTFSVEIDFALTVAAQSDRKMYRIGNISGSGLLLLVGPQSDGTVRFFARRNENSGFTSLFTGVLTSGVRYKVTASINVTTGALSLTLNNNAPITGQIPSYGSTSLSRTRVIGSESSSTGFCQFDLYGIKEFVNGSQISFYDPSGTSSGTTLFDTVGSSNGTLNNFTVPACWVFYSGGASNTITVSATLPKITGSLTLNEINPSYVISVSGQLPKLTGAVALNEINPVFTVAVAGQLPKLTGSISLNRLQPSRKVSVNGTLPKITGSIALNQFGVVRQAAVNGVLPKLTGAVTLNRIQPNNQVAVSGQLPRITASITLRVPDSYPAANPNDYTVAAYLSTDSTYTARLSESSTINAIISASSTFNARLN